MANNDLLRIHHRGEMEGGVRSVAVCSELEVSRGQKRTSSLPWSVFNALGLLVLFVVAQLILGLLSRFFALDSAGDTPSPTVFITVISLSHLITWLGVWRVSQRHQRQGLYYLGLTRQPCVKTLLCMVLLGFVVQIVGLMLLQLFPPPPELENPFAKMVDAGRWGIVVLSFTAVVMAPLLEEVLFRGLLQSALMRWGAWFAIGGTSVLFTALHALQLQGYWPALGCIFLMGWILGWLRHKTQSLWPSIVCHASYNGCAMILLLVALAYKVGLS